jgi:hypothetical protein
MNIYSKALAAGWLVSIALSAAAQAPAAGSSSFENLGRYRAYGGLMASTVAPGPDPGSQRLYASYLYADSTLDVIAIDPASGAAEVFHNPVPGEYGARNIAVGPDGDVYLGTLPHAHFLRVDRHAHRLLDLGRPSPSEEYIWDVAFGADQRLYGVTYPNCKLVRYDPATRKLEDLGRMDPTEKYGRWIVAGKDGFLYIGIGTAKANIAVYDTRTGQLREVLPKEAQTVGIAKPYIGVDGHAYATLDKRLFALDGFHIHEITGGKGFLTETDPRTHDVKSLPISYKGEDLQIFRVGFASNGQLYGSSILPIHFIHFDLEHKQVDEVGDLGGGEVYSLLAHRGHLLMGTYAGLAPLMSYDPGAPFQPGPSGNPALILNPGVPEHWRPQAMIEGPNGHVFVGGTADYGKLEAPLLEWEPSASSIQLHGDLIHDQSVVSLAVWKNFIVGGTTTQGGGGSHPTQTDARIFLWDTTNNTKTFDTIPVSGAEFITDLVTAKDGLVYGIAIAHSGLNLFTFDPTTRTILMRKPLPFRDVVYNGIGVTPAGNILGLAQEGIFTIDSFTHDARLIAPSPVKITGGFALREGYVYFVSNSELYRYKEADSLAH